MVSVFEIDLRKWKEPARSECLEIAWVLRHAYKELQMSLYWLSLLPKQQVFRVSKYIWKRRKPFLEYQIILWKQFQSINSNWL